MSVVMSDHSNLLFFNRFRGGREGPFRTRQLAMPDLARALVSAERPLALPITPAYTCENHHGGGGRVPVSERTYRAFYPMNWKSSDPTLTAMLINLTLRE